MPVPVRNADDPSVPIGNVHVLTKYLAEMIGHELKGRVPRVITLTLWNGKEVEISKPNQVTMADTVRTTGVQQVVGLITMSNYGTTGRLEFIDDTYGYRIHFVVIEPTIKPVKG